MDDEIYIIKVGTDEAVKSIADLRENIQAYKKSLQDLEIGSEDYNNTLRALQINQAALKDAMHATTGDAEQQAASMQDISKAAYGAGESYNALVRQMAMLDQEFRATEDVARRNELGKQINEINNRLKELDAERGKFQRNVGNYKSALDGLAQGFKATAGNAAAVINPIKNVKAGMDALSASPVIGMLGLLAAALSKVVSGMKTSEENTWAWNRALAAFKPIGDAFTRTLQNVGSQVADLAGKFVDLLYKWGLLDKQAGESRQALTDLERNAAERRRVLLVENVRLEADVAEAREKVQEKEKYTVQQRIEFLKQAQWAEEQIAKNNLQMAQDRLAILQKEASFSQNSIAVNDALAAAEADVERVRKDAARGQRMLQRELNTLERERQSGIKQTTEAVREEMETIAAIPATLTSTAQQMETAQEMMDRAVISHIEKRMEAGQKEHDQEVALQKARIQAAFQYAAAVASIAGSLADIYEANGQADAKAAAKAKGLRIAETTISTISGAVSAYMNTIESIKPTAVAIPLAVVNAATVLAAGFAQIKKIQSTKIPGAASSAGAVVQPPTVSAPAVQQVRTITGASEEERLNRMASGQRVYILASDLQAERNSTRVRVAETSF